jgi:hypothetical protein
MYPLRIKILALKWLKLKNMLNFCETPPDNLHLFLIFVMLTTFPQAAAPWQDLKPDQASDPEIYFSYLMTHFSK